MRTVRPQAGYTLLEVVIVAAIAIGGLALMGSLMGSTQDLSDDTRLHARAASEHRKNLRSLSNLLRGVDIGSLSGFDENGVATTPVFQRVTGVDSVERSYAGAERLEWRAATQPILDIERPGSIWLVGPAEERLVARNVPFGAFALRQEGGTLAIRLTTYWSLGSRRTHRVTSETAVSLRN